MGCCRTHQLSKAPKVHFSKGRQDILVVAIRCPNHPSRVHVARSGVGICHFFRISSWKYSFGGPSEEVVIFYGKCAALTEVIMCPYGRISNPQGTIEYSSKSFAK